MDQREGMLRALELAWRGWGRVQPNPLVGAVVLATDGGVLGEGWHAEFGAPHAETVALETAAERARGATLMVTNRYPRLGAWRERSLKPRIARAGGIGCDGCAAHTPRAPRSPR